MNVHYCLYGIMMMLGIMCCEYGYCAAPKGIRHTFEVHDDEYAPLLAQPTWINMTPLYGHFLGKPQSDGLRECSIALPSKHDQEWICTHIERLEAASKNLVKETDLYVMSVCQQFRIKAVWTGSRSIKFQRQVHRNYAAKVRELVVKQRPRKTSGCAIL